VPRTIWSEWGQKWKWSSLLEWFVNECVSSKHWTSDVWSDSSDCEATSEHHWVEVGPTWTQESVVVVHRVLVYTATSGASPALWVYHWSLTIRQWQSAVILHDMTKCCSADLTVLCRPSGIVELCDYAHIILRILGQAVHNLMSSAYFVFFSSKNISLQVDLRVKTVIRLLLPNFYQVFDN